METTNIYTLTDPRTNKVRYVGKANNVTQRYRAHLNKARKHQTHKWNWIQELKREGLKPMVDILDVVPMDDWRYWERYWINQIKQWGFNLVNYTDGGDGTSNGNQTSFKKGDGGKPVVGYNSECERVYEFDSMRQGEEFLKTRSMWGVLVGKRKTCKGLAWFYEEEIKKLNKDEIKSLVLSKFKPTKRRLNSGNFVKGQKGIRSKKVLMYDLDWNFIRKFDSAKSAGEYIGVTGGAIQFACTKSKKSKCKNNKFKYE